MTFIGTALLWGFFGILVAILAVGALLLLVLPSVLLRASCSVAEVKEPGYLVSFPVGYVVLLGFAGCIVGCGEALGAFWDANRADWFGPMHLFGYLAGFVLAWVCASLAYRVRHAITPSVLKGFWVAGLQVVLLAPLPRADGGAGLHRPRRLAIARQPPALLERPSATHRGARRPGRRRSIMILEGVVTTVSPAGRVNVAPMGPRLLGDPYAELQRFVLRPYRTAQTCATCWLTAKASCTSPTTCCCWRRPPWASRTRRRRCGRPPSCAAGCWPTPAAGMSFASRLATTGPSACSLKPRWSTPARPRLLRPESRPVRRGRGRHSGDANRLPADGRDPGGVP